jgi:hypothetical protein
MKPTISDSKKSATCILRIPLLKGEGGPKGRVRGEKMLLFTPHPPLRGTLSLQERDSLQTFFHFGQFWSETALTVPNY